MSSLQEILSAVTAMRGNRMTHIDTSSVQEKVDQIEWCLQALCETLIDAETGETKKVPNDEGDDDHPHKAKAKAKPHHR